MCELTTLIFLRTQKALQSEAKNIFCSEASSKMPTKRQKNFAANTELLYEIEKHSFQSFVAVI